MYSTRSKRKNNKLQKCIYKKQKHYSERESDDSGSDYSESDDSGSDYSESDDSGSDYSESDDSGSDYSESNSEENHFNLNIKIEKKIQKIIDEKINNDIIKNLLEEIFNKNNKNKLEIKEIEKKYSIKCEACNKQHRNCENHLIINKKSFNIGTYCIKRLLVIYDLFKLYHSENIDIEDKYRLFNVLKNTYKKDEKEIKTTDFSVLFH
jgi:hypothetical protein